MMALLLLLPLLLAQAPGDFTGKVVAVKDGDTIVVLRGGTEQVDVRLEGIDCPELGQAYGSKAKQATADLAAGRVCRYRACDRHRQVRPDVGARHAPRQPGTEPRTRTVRLRLVVPQVLAGRVARRAGG